MKKLGSLLVLLISLTASAQSDFDIAQEFMSKKGVTLKDNPSKTRGEKKPYSVFNGENNKGFAIVVNGCVVGYDTENTANEDDLPCCLKEILLENYSKTINPSKTRGDYTPDWWEPRDIEPIEPLVTSHWSQTSPYNDLLEKKTGICTLVAWCQLLHYFRNPRLFGKNDEQVGDTIYVNIVDSIGNIVGIDNSEDLKKEIFYHSIPVPVVSFNHDLILDRYDSNSSEEERNEVAKLFYYYTLVQSGRKYTVSYLGELLFDSHAGRWEDYLGFHKEGNYYEKEGEEKGLYYYYDKYLEQKYPFWESGGNHAYVVDGRDSEGRYHVNWGWGSGADGYYVFPDTKEQGKLYKEDENRNSYISCNTTCVPILIYPIKFSWTPPTANIDTRSITLSPKDGSIYNLQGIKVGNSLEGLPKGVYIQGGKKYVK